MPEPLHLKKNKLILALFFILAFAAGSYFFTQKDNFSENNLNTISIKDKKFAVELAISGQEQQKGLGGREILCPDCGMFFIFSYKGLYSFWMKDMKFPLDIIWISGDEIVFIAKNIPPDYQDVITPDIPADSVLEINGGLCDKYQIKKGDKIVFKE
jgi:hypothetical protein